MEQVQSRIVQKCFSREEANALIPFLHQALGQAYQELEALKDEVVLYKRMHQAYHNENPGTPSVHTRALADVLGQKWHAYEAAFHYWVNFLSEKGVQVRDFKKGIFDFPYRSRSGQVYSMCWHYGETSLMYYHGHEEGFCARRPIFLLPD